MNFKPDFLQFPDEREPANELLEYLQRQSPEVLERVAKSASPEVQEIVSQNVRGLLGFLPSEQFQVQISTDSDRLARIFCTKWSSVCTWKKKFRRHAGLRMQKTLNRDKAAIEIFSLFVRTNVEIWPALVFHFSIFTL